MNCNGRSVNLKNCNVMDPINPMEYGLKAPKQDHQKITLVEMIETDI